MNDVPSPPHTATESDNRSMQRSWHQPHAVSVMQAKHVMYWLQTAPPLLLYGSRNSIEMTWRCLLTSRSAAVHSNCIIDVTYSTARSYVVAVHATAKHWGSSETNTHTQVTKTSEKLRQTSVPVLVHTVREEEIGIILSYINSRCSSSQEMETGFCWHKESRFFLNRLRKV